MPPLDLNPGDATAWSRSVLLPCSVAVRSSMRSSSRACTLSSPSICAVCCAVVRSVFSETRAANAIWFNLKTHVEMSANTLRVGFESDTLVVSKDFRGADILYEIRKNLYSKV